MGYVIIAHDHQTDPVRSVYLRTMAETEIYGGLFPIECRIEKMESAAKHSKKAGDPSGSQDPFRFMMRQ
jgi:hypothetical protein